MANKQPTFRYFIKDKDGNSVNIDTLSEEERREVGVWAYRKLLEGLGYEPAKQQKGK
ncbi:MAG: hypothetical protein HDQ95_13950 [Roseburia sp.]|nr:hypothetical protein [Roseburia sp.]